MVLAVTFTSSIRCVLTFCIRRAVGDLKHMGTHYLRAERRFQLPSPARGNPVVPVTSAGEPPPSTLSGPVARTRGFPSGLSAAGQSLVRLARTLLCTAPL